MKKFFKWMIFLFISVNSWAIYYSTDFTSQPANWTSKLKYGFDIGITTDADTQTLTYNANGLTFNGYVVSSTSTLDSLKGVMVRFDSNFNATLFQPFGYEISRTMIRLDSDMEAIVNGNADNPESGRMWASFSLWLVEYKDGITNNNPNAKYDNFINFMEFYRPKLAYEPDTKPFSYWSVNDDKVGGFDLTAIPRPDGSGTTNLANYLQWCYDDRWGKNTTGNGGGTGNNFNQNNNPIKIRVTTDGEYAYLYINPNPTGSANLQLNDGTTGVTFPNEFILIGSNRISFSNNLLAMFGLEANRSDGETYTARITNFTIRTIASNVVSEIYPYRMKAGSTNHLYIAIHPEFYDANDAGIGEITISLPDEYMSYTNWTAFSNGISVHWANTNGTIFRTFGRQFGDVNPSLNNVSISLKDSGKTLKIRFRADSTVANSDVFHPDKFGGVASSNSILIIATNFHVSSTGNVAGMNFSIFVNNEKYSDTAWARIATTGRMKSFAGNALNLTGIAGVLEDNDTIVLKTYDNQVGIGAVSPNIMYEAQIKTFYYDLVGSNPTGNNANISRVEILIPTNFIIDKNTLASERGLSSNELYLSNANNGTNIIRVDYPAGSELGANGGRDTISFSIIDTPVVPEGYSEVTNYWKSISYSDLVGTVPTNNITNEYYPSQLVIVRKKPPEASAVLTTVTNFPIVISNKVANTAESNFYRFILQNDGDERNDIKIVRIALDKVITNVKDVQTLIPSSNKVFLSNENLYVDIFYTNQKGLQGVNGAIKSNDIITFVGCDNVNSLTNVIIASNYIYVDNLNGDGFNPVTNSTSNSLTCWEVIYYTPPASLSAYVSYPIGEDGDITKHNIYVDYEITNITLILSNKGEPGNDLLYAKILFPPMIIDILETNSISNALIFKSLEGVTNVLDIHYTNIGGLRPNTIDVLNIKVKDNVTLATNLSIVVEGQNTSNYINNLAQPPFLKNLDLHYIYSPAYVDGYVEVPREFISASVENYVLTNYVFNRGLPGNKINYVRFNYPADLITNITEITSLLNANIVYNYLTGVLELHYTNGIFSGQTNDIISYKVWHKATNTNFTISFSVSNDRWLTNNLPPTEGKSLNIMIAFYPTLYSYNIYPTVFYNNTLSNYTAMLTITISNRGWDENKLQTIRIRVPDLFTNKIVMVSNVHLGVTNDSGGPVTISPSNDILIDYTGNLLLPDAVDTNYVWFTIDTNVVTNLNWIVYAKNNFTPYLTNLNSFIGNGSNYISLVKRPGIYIIPSSVLTTRLYNDYSVRILDNGENAGRPVKKARIGFPTNFTTFININSGIPFTTINTTTIDETNFIELTYSSGIGVGGDNVTFTAYDNIEEETNLFVFAEVDYLDGEGWRSTGVISGYTNEVSFVRPLVSGVTYVSPRRVFVDFPTNGYTFYIKNTGEEGNNILKVKIIAPAYITNITGLQSSNGAPVETLTGDIITNIIYYTNTYTLSNDMFDYVSLVGYDNAESPTNGEWIVLVDNTMNGSGERTADVLVGQSLSNIVEYPQYFAEFSVIFTNSTTGGNGTNFYTIWETNYIKFTVYNQSESGTFINGLKIKIPSAGELFNTNDIYVTNLLKSQKVTNYLSNEYIVFDYSSNEIKSLERDDIILRIRDNINLINTNLDWSMEASFNTTYGRFAPATVYSGKTATSYYIMPSANARVYSIPNTVSVDFPTNKFSIFVSNTTSLEGNNLYILKIIIPDVITNITDITNLNSSYTPTYQIDSSNLYIFYTNSSIPKDGYDIIEFVGYDNQESGNSYNSFAVWINNTTNLNNFTSASVLSGYSLALNILQYPYLSYVYLEATNSVSEFQKNYIYSTLTTNYIKLYLTNVSSSASNNITYVKIPLLWIVDTSTLRVTNLVRAMGENMASNYIDGNDIILDYSKSNINVGEYDEVLISFVDFVSNINTNVIWSGIQAAYNTSYNIYKDVQVKPGKYITFNYVRPSAKAYVFSSPNNVSQDFPFVKYSIFISNYAPEPENNIHRVRIGLPSAITNVANITNLNSSLTPVFDITSSYIDIYYTNNNFLDNLGSGKYDIIEFDGYDNKQGGDDNYYSAWNMWVDNTCSLYIECGIIFI